MRNHHTTPQTNPAAGLVSNSGSNNVPPTRSFYESIFDELEPGWDNENLQSFDYNDYLVREGLA